VVVLTTLKEQYDKQHDTQGKAAARHCSNIIIAVKLLVDSSDGSDPGSSVIKLTCCGPPS
jgi:hypothetical protein